MTPTLPREYVKRIRLAAWAGLAALAATRAVLALMRFDPLTEMVSADIATYLLPILLSSVACYFTATRMQPGMERRFWLLLGVATTLILIVESHWTWYAANIDFHGPPQDAPIRALYLVASATFIGLILTLTPVGTRSAARRVRFYVDVGIAMTVGFAGMYLGWMYRLSPTAGKDVMTGVQSAIYTVVGVSMWLAIVAVLFGWKAFEWRRWEQLTVASLGLFGAGLILNPIWYQALLRETEPSASWITLLFGGGVYLLFIAAVYRATALPAEALKEPWPLRGVPQDRMAWRAYPSVMAASLPVFGWYVLRLGEDPIAHPLALAIGLLVLLLVTRSWLMALEIAHHKLRAVTDDVTGAYNDRYLRTRLDELIGMHGGYEACIVVFEIDGYRRMRDSYGRRVAEQVLRRLADSMLAQAPAGAEIFRLRGGRLVAVLTDTTVDAATKFAATVVVRERRTTASDDEPRNTIFAGIAAFPLHALDSDGLLACASAALDEARRSADGHVGVFDATEGGAPESSANLRTLRETVRVLAAAVDARDAATRHHSVHCAELATALARELNLDEERVQLIGLAALVHDVGKIGVSDEILLKPGKLTADERLAVMEHSELGERILEPANLGDILPLVRHHHERWDGQGYPDRLAGDQIPLEARILAVCDTYETITAGRPYRPAGTVKSALQEVAACAGSQFDPRVAGAFISMMGAHARPDPGRTRYSWGDVATGESSV